MLELAAGALRLVLDPETGGAIASFTHGVFPLLRPVADPRLAAQHGQPVAGYPLIPFANRIADGRFTVAGVLHRLTANFGDHPHTIHGNAWMRPWSVLRATATQVALALDHTPPADPVGEWPFAYHAEQVFTLLKNSLQLDMTLRNVDTVPWPAGLGFHPYLAKEVGEGAVTMLRFDADTVWLNGPDGLPVAREAVAHHWDFSEGRPVGEAEIDECYAGWGGAASVNWLRRGITLRLHTKPPLDHLQLYTPAARDFFGLEPVTNMPDAVNRMDSVADNGMTTLLPGEILRGSIRFDVAP